ncbi:MAG: HAD family acid phosphatase, partial [Rhodothalassiaceae bacterium]
MSAAGRFLLAASLLLAACATPPAPALSEPSLVERQPGLVWVRRSAEYALVTAKTYAAAAQALDRLVAARGADAPPWVVVMDADETILDNSLFTLEGIRAGRTGFDPVAWRAWVAREEAGAVPGAVAFIRHLLASGGRLAVVTNRDAADDDHTRANLRRIGVAVDNPAVCVLGHSAADRQRNNPVEWARYGYANDKDRRRRLVEAGKAEHCWAWPADPAEQAQRKAIWAVPAEILLSVGDNIQDMPGLTPDVADDPARLKALAADPHLVLIPNPL